MLAGNSHVNVMATQKGGLTISSISLEDKVFINGNIYVYKGQERRKSNGVTKTQYIFKASIKKGLEVQEWEKIFNINATLRIRKIGGKTAEVKFEIY